MTHQRGGTVLGFVLGVVFGLAVALAVAIYVTKVPVPFVSKALGRDPAQDINEQQKNKNWDPNAPLYGKNPIKPDGPPEEVVPRLPPGDAPAPATKTSSAKPASPAPSASAPAKEFKPAVTADPLGDLAKARAEAPKGSASSSSQGQLIRSPILSRSVRFAPLKTLKPSAPNSRSRASKPRCPSASKPAAWCTGSGSGHSKPARRLKNPAISSTPQALKPPWCGCRIELNAQAEL
jgi:hypothetical protein